MDRCGSCAAVLAPDAAWCGQCYAARQPVGRSVMDPVATPHQRAEQPPTLPAPPPFVLSRRRASATSFGLFGRLVMTGLLLLPLWWFWEVQAFAWPGLVIWGVFLLPWALRDVWRRSRVRAG